MLNISLDSIFECVYAFSAADALASGSEHPLILNTEQRPLLKRLALDVLSGVVLEFLQVIRSSNHTDEPAPDLICMEAALPARVSPLIFVRELETIVTLGIMRAVWSGTDTPMADKYRNAYERHLALVRNSVADGGCPGAIRPSGL